MKVIDIIGSQPGRVLRVAAGAALIAIGATGHGRRRLLIALGVVPLAAGGLDVCILGPWVGRPAEGEAFRRSSHG